jgi:integrase
MIAAASGAIGRCARDSPPPPGGRLAASGGAVVRGCRGERISRGTRQYRVLRAFRRAGIDADRARCALVHGLRHTFATELANSAVSVYTLMSIYETGGGCPSPLAASAASQSPTVQPWR